MTRFVIDAAVLIEIAAGNVDVHESHQLVRVTRLQADALVALDPELVDVARNVVPVARPRALARP